MKNERPRYFIRFVAELALYKHPNQTNLKLHTIFTSNGRKYKPSSTMHEAVTGVPDIVGCMGKKRRHDRANLVVARVRDRGWICPCGAFPRFATISISTGILSVSDGAEKFGGRTIEIVLAFSLSNFRILTIKVSLL